MNSFVRHSIFLITLFWSSTLVLGADTPHASWTPDLTTTQGQLQVMQTISAQHPGVFEMNSGFRQNPMVMLGRVPSLLKELGEDAASPAFGITQPLTSQFVSSSWKWNEPEIKNFKDQLVKALTTLPDFKLNGIQNDLKTLVALKNGGKSEIGAYLKLLPFLYADQKKVVNDLDSSERAKILETIKATGPSELDNLYRDTYSNHQKPVIQSDQAFLKKHPSVEFAFNSHENQFIRRTLPNAVDRISVGGGQAVIRSLSIEEMPASATIVKSLIAKDCGMVTVPYYGFQKGAKAYWIWKNSEARGAEAGYVFVAPVKVNGKTVPFLLTINGSTLTKSDVNHLIKLVAKDWNATEVIIPSGDEVKALINYTEVREGLNALPAKVSSVEFPESWKKIAQFQDAYTKGKTTNYYRNVNEGRLVKVDEIPTNFIHESILSPRLRYLPGSEDFSKMPLVDRAIIAAQATDVEAGSGTTGQAKRLDPATQAKVFETLNVDQKEADAGKILLDASLPQDAMVHNSKVKTIRGINRAEYDQLVKDLKVEWKDLRRMNAGSRIRSFVNLKDSIEGKEGKPILGAPNSKEKWLKEFQIDAKKLDTDAKALLDRPLEDELEQEKGISLIFNLKSELPDEVTEKWNHAVDFLGQQNRERPLFRLLDTSQSLPVDFEVDKLKTIIDQWAKSNEPNLLYRLNELREKQKIIFDEAQYKKWYSSFYRYWKNSVTQLTATDSRQAHLINHIPETYRGKDWKNVELNLIGLNSVDSSVHEKIIAELIQKKSLDPDLLPAVASYFKNKKNSNRDISYSMIEGDKEKKLMTMWLEQATKNPEIVLNDLKSGDPFYEYYGVNNYLNAEPSRETLDKFKTRFNELLDRVRRVDRFTDSMRIALNQSKLKSEYFPNHFIRLRDEEIAKVGNTLIGSIFHHEKTASQLLESFKKEFPFSKLPFLNSTNTYYEHWGDAQKAYLEEVAAEAIEVSRLPKSDPTVSKALTLMDKFYSKANRTELRKTIWSSVEKIDPSFAPLIKDMRTYDHGELFLRVTDHEAIALLKKMKVEGVEGKEELINSLWRQLTKGMQYLTYSPGLSKLQDLLEAPFTVSQSNFEKLYENYKFMYKEASADEKLIYPKPEKILNDRIRELIEMASKPNNDLIGRSSSFGYRVDKLIKSQEDRKVFLTALKKSGASETDLSHYQLTEEEVAYLEKLSPEKNHVAVESKPHVIETTSVASEIPICRAPNGLKSFISKLFGR